MGTISTFMGILSAAGSIASIKSSRRDSKNLSIEELKKEVKNLDKKISTLTDVSAPFEVNLLRFLKKELNLELDIKKNIHLLQEEKSKLKSLNIEKKTLDEPISEFLKLNELKTKLAKAINKIEKIENTAKKLERTMKFLNIFKIRKITDKTNEITIELKKDSKIADDEINKLKTSINSIDFTAIKNELKLFSELNKKISETEQKVSLISNEVNSLKEEKEKVTIQINLIFANEEKRIKKQILSEVIDDLNELKENI